MNPEEEIRNALIKVSQNCFNNWSPMFNLEKKDDLRHGDYSTNYAFGFFADFARLTDTHVGEMTIIFPNDLPKLKKSANPKELADQLVLVLNSDNKLKEIVYHIESAGTGFINFFIKPEVIREAAYTVGKIKTKFSGKKILVEHSSPNLFKPFHIGHLMNNIVGEFLTRGMSFANNGNVTVLCFPSDISFGIAKALYVLMKEEDINTSLFNEFKTIGSDEDLSEVVSYLGICYVKGTALIHLSPEDNLLVPEVRGIAKKLYDAIEGRGDKKSREYELWQRAHELNTQYFQTVIESIGSQMGKPIFESEVSLLGKDIVTKNIPNVFTASEGAVVYIPNEERKDINISVFINSEGHPTYEAKDLGLIYKKFFDYKETDVSLFVTDAEQTQHFKVVLDAASKLGGDWEQRVKKSIHVPHGRMLFKGQKMSSRLGGVPLALDVIAVVEEEVKERAGDKIANLSQEEKGKLAREIALSALRVAVLRSKPGININFDPETSLSFEGDSGPYLLYTHARCSSLLEKGKDIVPEFDNAVSVRALERTLLHFNKTLRESIEDIAPQKLVTYLFLVAQEFNSFYGQEQILSENVKKTAHNLAIVSWTKEVLKQGLYVLGITAPERM